MPTPPFVEQSLLSAILAFIGLMFTEPKKQRIANYNILVDKLIDEAKKVQKNAIEYWSSTGQQQKLEAEIVASRTECTRLALLLKGKCKGFLYRDVKRNIDAYFRAVTGGAFQQQTRSTSLQILNEVDLHMISLLSNAEASKYQFTILNFFTKKVH